VDALVPTTTLPSADTLLAELEKLPPGKSPNPVNRAAKTLKVNVVVTTDSAIVFILVYSNCRAAVPPTSPCRLHFGHSEFGSLRTRSQSRFRQGFRQRRCPKTYGCQLRKQARAAACQTARSLYFRLSLIETRANFNAVRMRKPASHNGSFQLSKLLLVLLCSLLFSGCSIKKFAVNKLGDALAGSTGSAFTSDDDPELIRGALPFSLKLIESLLAESPRHTGLLLAASSGFTQYSYAYVHQDADETEDRDLAAANALHARARRLYLRARDYGLRGLEVHHRNFGTALRQNPKTAVRVVTPNDVPLMYWTAASWGAAISLSKDNPDLVADFPIVEALLDRAVQLDEEFDGGALHVFLISLEMARAGGEGDPAMRAEKHFERALALGGQNQVGPLIAYAEAVCVKKQDKAQFRSLLNRALAVNPDATPKSRLLTLVLQRRARWLLTQEEELFVETENEKK
jgi:predicted anti-sigma-YlaC factor YlaD